MARKHGPNRLYIGGYILLSADCPRPPLSFEKTHIPVDLDRFLITDRPGALTEASQPRQGRPEESGPACEKPLHCRALWSEAVGAGTAGAHDAKGGPMAGTGRIYRRGTIYYIAYRWDGRPVGRLVPEHRLDRRLDSDGTTLDTSRVASGTPVCSEQTDAPRHVNQYAWLTACPRS